MNEHCQVLFGWFQHYYGTLWIWLFDWIMYCNSFEVVTVVLLGWVNKNRMQVPSHLLKCAIFPPQKWSKLEGDYVRCVCFPFMNSHFHHLNPTTKLSLTITYIQYMIIPFDFVGMGVFSPSSRRKTSLPPTPPLLDGAARMSWTFAALSCGRTCPKRWRPRCRGGCGGKWLKSPWGWCFFEEDGKQWQKIMEHGKELLNIVKKWFVTMWQFVFFLL